jgi:WD40 repeat protein
VDNIAFRPGKASQLATAGGPNHEVRLWNWRKEQRLDTIASPGSGIWTVAMSRNGRYLAWKDQLNRQPKHPNDRGSGPWRVFNLEGAVHRILPRVPADFIPLEPLRTLNGWSIQTTESSYLWRILGPGDTNEALDDSADPPLYFAQENQIPRCYTFLRPTATKPVRLAVGHMWGVSIYELRPNNVRLSRLLIGHEGEVMSVAPSPDGKLLVTGSRDQTICCWSLEDWPSQRELGASFIKQGGKLLVRKVDPGSPAWEADMSEGDEIQLVVSTSPKVAEGYVYGPDALIKRALLAGRHCQQVGAGRTRTRAHLRLEARRQGAHPVNHSAPAATLAFLPDQTRERE